MIADMYNAWGDYPLQYPGECLTLATNILLKSIINLGSAFLTRLRRLLRNG